MQPSDSKVTAFRWLQFDSSVRQSAVFSGAAAILIPINELLHHRPEKAEALGLIFGIWGAPVCLHALRFKVGYDGSGIYTRSAWRPSRFIPWNDVTLVTFSRFWKQWVLSSEKHGTLRINVLVTGVTELLVEACRRGIKVVGGVPLR